MVAQAKKFGLIFPGQGSQEVGMGRDLYEKEPAARWVYDTADKVTGKGIKRLCFEGPEDELMTTVNSQPAIFVTSMATLNVLVEKIKGSPVGVEPREFFLPSDIAMAGSLAMGLSLGEPTSLVAAGALSFEDGLMFVKRRGELMEDASREKEGAMSSILGLPLDKVEEIARGVGCEIANLNCPDQVVISGEKFKVELAQDLCKNAGAKRCIMLKVSGAFHSRLMVNAKAKLKTVLDNMKISEPVVDFISNMDAEVTRDTARIRQNLANQLDSRTLWERSVRNAVSMGYKDFIEVGPGSVLKGLLRKIDTGINVTALHTSEEITAFAQSLKA